MFTVAIISKNAIQNAKVEVESQLLPLVGKELIKAGSFSHSCGVIQNITVDRFDEYGGCYLKVKTDKTTVNMHSSNLTDSDRSYGWYTE